MCRAPGSTPAHQRPGFPKRSVDGIEQQAAAPGVTASEHLHIDQVDRPPLNTGFLAPLPEFFPMLGLESGCLDDLGGGVAGRVRQEGLTASPDE